MSTQLSTQSVLDGGRIFVPLPIPPIFPPDPWPWPSPVLDGPAERDAGGGEPFATGDVLEVAEAVYARPDVRATVRLHARTLAELIGSDEEASREFQSLIREIAPGQEERAVPVLVIYGACLLAGGILGYFSRK